MNFKGEQRAQKILDQHKDIFTYIKNREAERAAEQMIKHLDDDVEHLLRVLEE